MVDHDHTRPRAKHKKNPGTVLKRVLEQLPPDERHQAREALEEMASAATHHERCRLALEREHEEVVDSYESELRRLQAEHALERDKLERRIDYLEQMAADVREERDKWAAIAEENLQLLSASRKIATTAIDALSAEGPVAEMKAKSRLDRAISDFYDLRNSLDRTAATEQ